MIKTKVINKLNKIAKRNSYQPILTNLLIQDGSISTYDLDNRYSLIGLDKSIKGLVKLERDLIGENASINSNSLNFGSNAINLDLDISEYPKFDLDFSGNDLIKLDLALLKCAMNFASTYDLNNILGGINFNIEDNVLMVNATDGNILYSNSIVIESDHKNIDITIPIKSLKDFISLIQDKKDTDLFISVDVTGRYMGLSCGDVTCELKALEGTYPRVQNFLNPEIKNTLNTDFKKFIKANTDILKLANEITYITELQDNKLIAEHGSISIDLKGHKDIDIHYSAKLMKRVLTGLKEFKQKDLSIGLTGSVNPMYLEVGLNFGKALLMPIKHEK